LSFLCNTIYEENIRIFRKNISAYRLLYTCVYDEGKRVGSRITVE